MLPFLTRQFDHNVKQGIVREQADIFTFHKQLRAFFAQSGLNEIVTFSIEAAEELAATGQADLVMLANPLRQQENALRPGLLVGALKAVKYNLNHDQTDLGFFELADGYKKEGAGIAERRLLSCVLCGGERDFAALKGVVEGLVSHLNIKEVQLKEAACPGLGDALAVYAADVCLGHLGPVAPVVADRFDLKVPVYFAQLDCDALRLAAQPARYKKFSAYPQVWRDISLVLKSGRQFRTVETLICDKAQEVLVGLKIIDRYRAPELDKDDAAFTLRVFYQSAQRTLTAHEVDTLHGEIRRRLSATEGIALR